jgi:DHA3 family macrolide efflux protein-like MFS transporter
MLIGGITLGLVLGLLLGGRLEHLADIRLRFLPLLFIAVIVRFTTEAMLGFGVSIVDTLRVPLLGAAYGLLLFTLWKNRGYPGLALAFVGIASNAIAIIGNGGRMPVWMPAYEISGITGPLSSVLHTPLEVGSGPEFFFHLGPLSDVIPIPIWPINNVASIGDAFLSAGLAFFLFATLLRAPEETQRAIDEAKVGRYLGLAGTARLPDRGVAAEAAAVAGIRVRGGTGLAPGLEDAASLERPLMLGSGGVGMASPALSARPMEADAGSGALALGDAGTATLPGIRVRPEFLPRVREHPYVRLALNGSFSALWVGQVISLFGDRVNQIALGAFVYEVTDSAFALALTFLVATLPNLVFSPIAGTFVDRWDKKQVLVVSDILRAALVLLVPVAVLIDVWLAYPLVFLITTVSIFFRPARIAILPRLVPTEDLLSANSALWVGETVADVVNYPIAGLFVVFLASSLPIAFWIDAATYLASAALLATIVVPPLLRRARPEDELAEDGTLRERGDAQAPEGIAAPATIIGDLKAGWAFLRHETVLLANTLQGTAGQFAVGIVTVASLVLAQQITPETGSAYRGTWAFMETAIGLGNLVGGFALGLVASRVHKGMLVIAAYTGFGVLVFLLGVISSIPLVLGILFGIGIANMAFVIPSQTLFQERTPPELMGRVVSFRFALVFGGMSVAMGIGGLFVGAYGPGPVIAAAGTISIAAGLAGLGVRAVREA